MYKFIKYILTINIICVVFIAVTTISIVLFPCDAFDGCWQSILQARYERLTETNSPKIIMISGSSSTFGLDQNYLESKTGYNVVNLGIQASLGPEFLCELSKANINEGDIVLFGYEYTWWNEWTNFDSLRMDLLLSGIGDKYEIYKYIPVHKYPELMGYLFTFASLKIDKDKEYTGTYSINSFDLKTTQMILDRPYINYTYSEESEGIVDFSQMHIDEKVQLYLKKYKEYVEKQGADIFFVSPPIVEKCIRNEEYVQFFIQEEEEKIGIDYISNPADYFFPEEYMFDTYYHCNNIGEKERTKLLINDLQNAGIID